MNFGWIDPALLRDFQAEGTDAHRLCTFQDGWVERFGRDVLISFKSVLTRERLLERTCNPGQTLSEFQFDEYSRDSSLEKMNSANRRV